MRHKSSFTGVPLHRKKALLERHLNTLASFGVGAIYIFNITPVGSAGDPISKLVRSLHHTTGLHQCVQPHDSNLDCLANKDPVLLCTLTVHCAPHRLLLQLLAELALCC